MEITKALADSYALCYKAFADVTDANAIEMIKQGPNETTRAAALYGVIVHGNEMAGTAYVYLRSKNIVPPSTERAMMGRGRGNNQSSVIAHQSSVIGHQSSVISHESKILNLISEI